MVDLFITLGLIVCGFVMGWNLRAMRYHASAIRYHKRVGNVLAGGGWPTYFEMRDAFDEAFEPKTAVLHKTAMDEGQR